MSAMLQENSPALHVMEKDDCKRTALLVSQAEFLASYVKGRGGKNAATAEGRGISILRRGRVQLWHLLEDTAGSEDTEGMVVIIHDAEVEQHCIQKVAIWFFNQDTTMIIPVTVDHISLSAMKRRQ